MPWQDLFNLTTSIVTDGASVNTGKNKGLWSLMKNERSKSLKSNVPLFSIWCVAHRANLAWKAFCKQNVMVENVINQMSKLSTYFHSSGERTQKLRKISEENNLNNIVNYPAYFAVRWTEFTYNLLNSVLRNWTASIIFFTKEKEFEQLNFWLNYHRIPF